MKEPLHAGLRANVTAFDWQEIHERADRLRSVIEQGWTPTDEEKRKVLRTRALALAGEPPRSPDAEERLEVLAFRLASEQYALESRHVREVQPLREFTPLPGTPSFVLGVVNIRGQIVSVIDPKKFFELPERGLTDLNKVIVVNVGDMELGILADGIVGVKTVPLRELQEPLPTLTGIRAEYLRGIAKDGLILLDVERILSDKTILVPEPAE
jgi:purine-binding chemotaxis protein CheW